MPSFGGSCIPDGAHGGAADATGTVGAEDLSSRDIDSKPTLTDTMQVKTSLVQSTDTNRDSSPLSLPCPSLSASSPPYLHIAVGGDDSTRHGTRIGGTRRFVVMTGLFLAFFLAALDQAIVAAIMPTLGEEFDAISSTSWVSTIYMLTMAALQPVHGKASDIFGRVPLLVAGLIVFLAGSALCGAAKSMVWLIAARAVMGLGAGCLMSLVRIVISDLTALNERGKYLSLTAFAWVLASTCGPVMGAAISKRAGWRWCFYLNLPVGTITAFVVLLFLRLPTAQRDSLANKLRRIDILGAVTAVMSTVLLLLALSWGGKSYAWDSPTVIAALVSSLALLLAFVAIETWVAAEPIIDLKLFRDCTVAAVFTASALIGMITYSAIYYIPLFFSAVFHTDALGGSIRLLAYMVAIAVFSLVCGQLMSALNGHYRLLVAVGFALCTVGHGVLLLLRPGASLGKQLGLQILAGIGVGIVFPSTIVAAQVAASPDMMAVSTTIVVFTRLLGGSIGLAILDAVYYNTLRPRLGAIGAQHRRYKDAIMATQDSIDRVWTSSFPPGVLQEVVDAYYHSLHTVFLLMVPLAGLGFACSLLIKVRNQSGGAGEVDEATASGADRNV